MTNGAVGQTVSSVDVPVLTVKYKDGEKKLIVGPSVPVQRLEIADRSELKSGAAVAAGVATSSRTVPSPPPAGRMVTGPQHYRRRRLSPVVAKAVIGPAMPSGLRVVESD
jgi:hypothetical protein